MKKVRQAPPGAKPTYEAIAERLEDAKARNESLEHRLNETEIKLTAAHATIETLTQMLARHIEQAIREEAKPIPF